MIKRLIGSIVAAGVVTVLIALVLMLFVAPPPSTLETVPEPEPIEEVEIDPTAQPAPPAIAAGQCGPPDFENCGFLEEPAAPEVVIELLEDFIGFRQDLSDELNDESSADSQEQITRQQEIEACWARLQQEATTRGDDNIDPSECLPAEVEDQP